MPTYEYECPNCGHEWDSFVSASQRDNQICPECSGTAKQVIRTAPAIDWDALAMGDSASPEAIRHFERKRKQRKAQEDKSKREHGDYGPAAGT